MSGPKCTNYRLQEQRRRELERKRLQQEKQKNLQILTKLKQRINSYQYLQENQKNQLLVGIKNAEKETQEDKYLAAQKLIQGIKLYLDVLERNQQRAEDKIESEQLIARAMPNDKNHILLNEINTINNYTDIKDNAIEQRVDYYTNVINKSLENNVPLSSKDERNIRLFIDKVDEMKSDYDKNIAQKQYVQSVLGEIIGAKHVKGSNNISGSIGDTPVNVNFGSDGEIIFNISDGNIGCHDALDRINKSLKAKQIHLGDVYIERTGNTIKLNTSEKTNFQSQDKRVKQ